MKKKKSKFKKYGFIGIVLVTILLGFTAYSIDKDRKLTFVEKAMRDAVLTVGDILATPFQYIKEKWMILDQNEVLNKKYNDLQKEYLSIDQYKESMRELQEENQKLKELLDINHSLLQYEKVSATVISRDPMTWLESFTIDKGSKDGIQENMAVIGNGGLVGYVAQTSFYTSTIKLLTNPSLENKISIKIEISEGEYAYGLLGGYDSETGSYYIEGISDYVVIPINAKVTTTGLGDRFPSGLLIGTVQDIETDSFDLAKVVYVKPFMKTDDISFVSVLIREEEAS